MTLDVMAAEIAEQPAVLERILERAPGITEELRALVPGAPGGVVLVGRGSSGNAAVLGRYAFECATGRPAGLAAPSISTRYGAVVDYRGTLVVALSQSGSTPEIVATCAAMRASGAKVVAIVNEPGSDLAATSDLTFEVGAGPELAVPATKTVTGEMLLVLLLASAFSPGLPGAGSLASLPSWVHAVLESDEAAAGVAQSFAAHPAMMICGRGAQLCAALETALKVKESALVLAEGISSADLLHGPIAALGARTPVLLLGGGAKTAADDLDTAARVRATGAPLVSCGPLESDDLSVPASMPDLLAPVVSTVRGQQFAYQLARARGLDPGSPPGLTKVTLTY